jgi:DnaJ family protein A protein 2
MPSYRHHDFGNLFIQFNVKFPEKNWTEDPTAFESLRTLLPPPSLVNVPPAEAMSEPADLEEVDNSAGAKAFAGAAGGMAMEEDDEDGHPHAERVQCASQ